MTSASSDAPTGLTDDQIDRLIFNLNRLPDMYSWLDGMHTPDRKPRDPDARRTIPGSRIALDLAVIDLTNPNPKHNLHVDMHYPWPDQAATNPDRIGIRPALHNWLTYIIGDIRDHGAQADPPPGIHTIHDLCTHIASHADWIRQADWATTLSTHINHMICALAPYAPNRQPQADKRRDLTLWPIPDIGELLTTHDAADWLRVTPRTIRMWIHRGHLDYHRDNTGREIRDEHGRKQLRRADLLACAARRAC